MAHPLLPAGKHHPDPPKFRWMRVSLNEKTLLLVTAQYHIPSLLLFLEPLQSLLIV
jgi:hypothetical protein